MPQFTKNAILNSFVGLLNKYPLNKISVKDIVDDCGINRSTFYYYFEDIYALLSELFQSETEKILNMNEGSLNWQDAFLVSTKFARENKKAVYHIYHSISREYLDKYLYSVIGHFLGVVVHNEIKDYDVSENDVGIIVDVYKFALVGMIYNWLEAGMDKEFDEIASRMYELLGDNIKYTLARTDKRYEVITTIRKKSDT